MSRYLDIEPHVPGLRRFVEALAGRRCDTGAAAGNRTAWIIQRSVSSALAQSGHATATQLRNLLFLAAIQHHRANLRQEKFRGADDPAAATAFASAPQQMDALPAEQRTTRLALARLPVESREVLLLVVLAQVTYTEVAEILGLPLSDVFARLTRARLALGSLLDQSEAVATVPQLATSRPASPGKAAAQHLRLVK